MVWNYKELCVVVLSAAVLLQCGCQNLGPRQKCFQCGFDKRGQSLLYTLFAFPNKLFQNSISDWNFLLVLKQNVYVAKYLGVL